MNTTLPRGTRYHKRELGAVHGTARWLGVFRPQLLDLGAALLEITTAKGVTREYFVRRLTEGGAVQGYTLTRTDNGKVHAVDVSFGGDWRSWSCDCPDYIWNSRYRPAGEQTCKHAKSLGLALARVGL